MEFDKNLGCQNLEFIVDNQKHQIEKKLPEEDNGFSKRLPYANKNLRKNIIK